MKKKVAYITFMIAVLLGITGCDAVRGAAENEGLSTETVMKDTEQISQMSEDTESINMHPTEPYLVENPEDGYYSGSEEDDVLEPDFELVLFSEQANAITDQEEWFLKNGITAPSFPYADENYEYQVYGEIAYKPTGLKLYDLKNDELLADLDFSEYQYANDFAEENRTFAAQGILWAKAEDGILYAAIAHNTYAVTSPHTAYVVAIDLSARSVIWKSEPLVCNSKSFELIDGSIVCGYGFSEEEDYLNIIDKKTGRLQGKLPLNTGPEYIVRSDDVLYVRTYDTDYMFEIKACGAAVETNQKQSQFMENYHGDYEKEIKLAGTKIRFRMITVDAALGSRAYGLLKSSDDGISWNEVSLNPFDSQTGMGIDFIFLDEEFGFAALTENGGDSASLWVTEDGGKSYKASVLEKYTVALDDDFFYEPYDFPQMPYEKNGVIYVLCGQGADGDYNGGDENQLARYKSSDRGHTFVFDQLVAAERKG